MYARVVWWVPVNAGVQLEVADVEDAAFPYVVPAAGSALVPLLSGCWSTGRFRAAASVVGTARLAVNARKLLEMLLVLLHRSDVIGALAVPGELVLEDAVGIGPDDRL